MIAANLGLLLTAIAWGSLIPVLNLLIPQWDPYFLAAIRYALGTPVFLLLLLVVENGRLVPGPVSWWRLWLLGGVGIGLFAPLYTLGIAHSNPITAAVIGSTGPAVAAIVAWAIYRTPPERGTVPAILLAIAGGVLATYDPGRSGVPFDLRGGEVLILLASACWAWYSLMAQHWLRGWSQLRICGITMVPGSVVLIAVYLLASLTGAAHLPPAVPSTAPELGLFAWIIFASVVTGVFLWHFGVGRLGVVVASLFLNLAPVAAILISAALGTRPTALQLLGGALVIGGVLQAQLRHLLGARSAKRRRGVA
jgi:drug/metabolite transporter (DMT)-like permease